MDATKSCNIFFVRRPQNMPLSVHVYIDNKMRKTKFDEKSWKGILVGYEPNEHTDQIRASPLENG